MHHQRFTDTDWLMQNVITDALYAIGMVVRRQQHPWPWPTRQQVRRHWGFGTLILDREEGEGGCGWASGVVVEGCVGDQGACCGQEAWGRSPSAPLACALGGGALLHVCKVPPCGGACSIQAFGLPHPPPLFVAMVGRC